MLLRSGTVSDYYRVLELNEESVHFLSPLTAEKLEALMAEAEVFWVVEVSDIVEAFVLAFKEGAEYGSVNYQWFNRQYENFLYIDRVVVSIASQGQGAGKGLYNAVIQYALKERIPFVTAEVDIEPPNEVSLAFHSRFGFTEVGRQTVGQGKKIVSLQQLEIQLDY